MEIRMVKKGSGKRKVIEIDLIELGLIIMMVLVILTLIVSFIK